MSFYPEDLVEEVRVRNDIVDVISGYVRLQKKGRDYFGLCPFHNEKSPSFSVSPGKQMYYCFGCGAGGNVLSFLMEYEKYSFSEALESLADRVGIALPKQELSEQAKRESDKRKLVLEINRTAAKYFYALLRSSRGSHAYDYFKNRGLSNETMQKFGLGYSDKFSNDLYEYLKKQGYTDEMLKESGLVSFDERRGGYDKFWNRAMFPIMDVHNRVIGFGGRVMGEGEPKYLNSPETIIFDKSRNLYGLNVARSSKRPGFILCEGYMDVIALHQAGFDNAVASLGTAFTSGHASLIKRYAKEAFLSFDSDGAGVRAALRAIPILREAGITPKVINMKPYKDPDEFLQALGKEAYEKRIEEAENFFFFEVRIAQEKYDLQDPDGKTRFFTEIAQMLLQFEDGIERENYITAIAQKYQTGFENLRKLVVQEGTKTGLAKPRPPLKTGIQSRQGKEENTKRPQKLLLTWLIEYPELYPQLRSFIGPQDFTEDIFRKVAKVLFKQLEEHNVNPAKIVSMFEEEEEQRQVAELFHTTIHDLDTKEDMQKAVHDVVQKIKQSSIENASEQINPMDMEELGRLIQAKKQLESLEKLHISID